MCDLSSPPAQFTQMAWTLPAFLTNSHATKLRPTRLRLRNHSAKLPSHVTLASHRYSCHHTLTSTTPTPRPPILPPLTPPAHLQTVTSPHLTALTQQIKSTQILGPRAASLEFEPRTSTKFPNSRHNSTTATPRVRIQSTGWIVAAKTKP